LGTIHVLDDPHLLFHLLDDDVAEQAPVAEAVILPAPVHLLHHPLGDDGKGDQLGMAVGQGRPGGRPVVLEDEDRLEPAVLRQVDETLPVGPENVLEPLLGQVEQVDVVTLRLDDDLVGPDAVHPVVDPVRGLPQLPLDLQRGKLVGDHAQGPVRIVGLPALPEGEDLGGRHPLAAGAQGAHPLAPGRGLRGKFLGTLRPLGGDDDPPADDRIFPKFRHAAASGGERKSVEAPGGTPT